MVTYRKTTTEGFKDWPTTECSRACTNIESNKNWSPTERVIRLSQLLRGIKPTVNQSIE